MVTDDICTTDVSIIASPLPSSLPPVPPALSSSSTMPQKLSYKGREDLNLLPFGAANDWVLSAPFPSRSQAHVLVDKLLSSGLESELSKNNIISTLFKQPISNKSILFGIFEENGEILDLFENK